MTDPEYALMSKRLGFRMLEDHDLKNLMRLDMNLEVRAFFPEGVSTPKKLQEKIIRSRASFLHKGFGEFSVTDMKTNDFLGRAGFAELNNGEAELVITNPIMMITKLKCFNISLALSVVGVSLF